MVNVIYYRKNTLTKMEVDQVIYMQITNRSICLNHKEGRSTNHRHVVTMKEVEHIQI